MRFQSFKKVQISAQYEGLNSINMFMIKSMDWSLFSRHFGSYQQSKLSLTQRKGRYSAVRFSQLSRAGQYKKCVQYDFQFTSEYSVLGQFVRNGDKASLVHGSPPCICPTYTISPLFNFYSAIQ